jgi:hypothetical protein
MQSSDEVEDEICHGVRLRLALAVAFAEPGIPRRDGGEDLMRSGSAVDFETDELIKDFDHGDVMWCGVI